jgi:mannonate dehydratase
VIGIAEYFMTTHEDRTWTLLRQVGVEHAVSVLPWDDPRVRETREAHESSPFALYGQRSVPRPWDFEPLAHMQARYEDAGFELAVIEDSPPMEETRAGRGGRDQEIEWLCTLIENMGRLGIPVLQYTFMAGLRVQRSSFTRKTRGGALVSEYDHDLIDHGPTPAGDHLSADELWENFAYFVRAVVPVAEAANVRLALHPDDPPISPIRGVERIMCSLEAMRRALDLVPSRSNAITFCQGNLTLLTDDLPSAIRDFGAQDEIAFVHYRDVRGTPAKFIETFHDDGQTDMLACMRAYKDIGFEGVLRSDHVPTLDGDSHEIPGYSTLGRLHAVGYIAGLREAAYGKVAAT